MTKKLLPEWRRRAVSASSYLSNAEHFSMPLWNSQCWEAYRADWIVQENGYRNLPVRGWSMFEMLFSNADWCWRDKSRKYWKKSSSGYTHGRRGNGKRFRFVLLVMQGYKMFNGHKCALFRMKSALIFTREIIDRWVLQVCYFGMSFRDAFFSTKALNIWLSVVSAYRQENNKWVGAKAKRRLCNDAFSFFCGL